MALRVVLKEANLHKSIEVQCRDIPVGMIFSGEIGGKDQRLPEKTHNVSKCFLRTYTHIVDLISPECTWNNLHKIKVFDYKEVDATLTVE